MSESFGMFSSSSYSVIELAICIPSDLAFFFFSSYVGVFLSTSHGTDPEHNLNFVITEIYRSVFYDARNDIISI